MPGRKRTVAVGENDAGQVGVAGSEHVHDERVEFLLRSLQVRLRLAQLSNKTQDSCTLHHYAPPTQGA